MQIPQSNRYQQNPAAVSFHDESNENKPSIVVTRTCTINRNQSSRNCRNNYTVIISSIKVASKVSHEIAIKRFCKNRKMKLHSDSKSNLFLPLTFPFKPWSRFISICKRFRNGFDHFSFSFDTSFFIFSLLNSSCQISITFGNLG